MGRDSSVGIATRYGRGSNPGGGEIFRIRPDRPWGPPSLLYNGYRVFPGDKAAGGAVLTTHPHLSAEVTKGYSYTSTHPLGLRGLLQGELYLYLQRVTCGISDFPFILNRKLLSFQL